MSGINEELTGTQKTVSKNIARFTNRVGRKLITAEGTEKTDLLGALMMLNQAQSVVQFDASEARKLLATARRLFGTAKDDDSE